MSGCAQTADQVAGFFTAPWKKTPEQLLNIKTPDDRLEELRKLAKSAKKKSPEEQERISGELAKEIQNENDPRMRRQILRTLAFYPTTTAAAVLAAGLHDADAEVRIIACRSWGKRGGKDAVQELSRVIASDTDLDVRIAAVRAIGQTKDAAAMPALGEVLLDPNPALQFNTVQSLRAVSGHDFGDDLQAWRQYATTGHADAQEVSIAERVRRYFR